MRFTLNLLKDIQNVDLNTMWQVILSESSDKIESKGQAMSVSCVHKRLQWKISSEFLAGVLDVHFSHSSQDNDLMHLGHNETGFLCRLVSVSVPEDGVRQSGE